MDNVQQVYFIGSTPNYPLRAWVYPTLYYYAFL